VPVAPRQRCSDILEHTRQQTLSNSSSPPDAACATCSTGQASTARGRHHAECRSPSPRAASRSTGQASTARGRHPAECHSPSPYAARVPPSVPEAPEMFGQHTRQRCLAILARERYTPEMLGQHKRKQRQEGRSVSCSPLERQSCSPEQALSARLVYDIIGRVAPEIHACQVLEKRGKMDQSQGALLRRLLPGLCSRERAELF